MRTGTAEDYECWMRPPLVRWWRLRSCPGAPRHTPMAAARRRTPVRSDLFNTERALVQRRVSAACGRLLADSQLLDERAVALDVLVLQVVQHAATLADEHHETATGMVVLGVRLEVSGQIADPLAEDGNLDLGRPRVLLVRP